MTEADTAHSQSFTVFISRLRLEEKPNRVLEQLQNGAITVKAAIKDLFPNGRPDALVVSLLELVRRKDENVLFVLEEVKNVPPKTVTRLAGELASIVTETIQAA